MMIIENKFNIGDVVYLKTDESQAERIITAMVILPNVIRYATMRGTTESTHYDFEFSYEKNFVLKNNKEDGGE
jgi:hypothetical protein